MTAGKLLILSAPSGAGKSSLAQALRESDPNIAISVSHTTRAPRPGERHGVHYFFVDPPTFEAMARRGEFLEHARVFGNSYGTSRTAVTVELSRGKHVVLDIDWQGARAVRAQMPQALSVFILPPSRAELEARLHRRAQDSHDVIAARMQAAIEEMRHYAEFDYAVINDDFGATLADLKAILGGEPDKRRAVTLDIPALLRG